jgi:hypothetical protein
MRTMCDHLDCCVDYACCVCQWVGQRGPWELTLDGQMSTRNVPLGNKRIDRHIRFLVPMRQNFRTWRYNVNDLSISLFEMCQSKSDREGGEREGGRDWKWVVRGT